jgi:hypothetical protein
MNEQQLQNALHAVLGNNGLNLSQLSQGITTALQALQNAQNAQPQACELSIIKVPDFYGKANEDPFEWIDHFEQAAEANRWTTDARKISIVQGYLRGAAAD